MSDMEKPNETVSTPAAETPAPETPAAEQVAPEEKADRIHLLRDKAAQRQQKPVQTPRPPSLQHEVTYGFGKKIDAFDDEMERQLQEALGGATLESQLGEPIQHGKRGQ